MDNNTAQLARCIAEAEAALEAARRSTAAAEGILRRFAGLLRAVRWWRRNLGRS